LVVDFKLVTIVIAKRNSGKLREFRSLMAPSGLTILSLTDIGLDKDFEETGSSFAENARLKALAYSEHSEHPVLADDSGLEVFALDRRPGIYSARYAGPGATDADRIEKLLEELKKCGRDRSARFVCALALARRGTVLLEAEGECCGVIADNPRGTNGFGYDPIFLFPELGRTYAELSEEEKNRYSHRACAIRALRAQMAH
jgi:XTP/dITP diphosphohydrolase